MIALQTLPSLRARTALPAAPGPRRALLTTLAMMLAGCASVAPQRPSGPAPGPPPGTTGPQTTAPPTEAAPPPVPIPGGPGARTANAEMLAIEQRWLQDWFRGTPVRISQRSDGTLAVDVPREFCFEAGRSQVKPALGAVLDKVAQSLRRRPGTRLTLLSAPSDPAGSGAPATLALQRAADVHRHLRSRGIALARLGEPVAEGSSAVQLRIGAQTP
ncbi:MAG: hypothetical protein Q7U73_00440 [Rubrivivax sp.]|nr:hypothetical protein [Rubrivivax sp.]